MPKVTLVLENESYEVEENEIIFDSLQDQGKTLPHGCLAGSCGSCRVEICKGLENLSPMGLIESDTVASILEDLKKRKGEDYIKERPLRLACRARVRGDISIKPYR